jgi:hypothetical protein
MAATIIENQGTEPFVLPAPFRGIIDPGKRIYLNLSLAVVANALGGSSTYRPTEGAQLKIALLYDASYAGAYDTFNQGNADGSNSVPIPAGQVPYGNLGGTALTSEAALAYNATTNTLSAGAFTASGPMGNGTFGGTLSAGSVNATTAFGMGGATPAVRGAAIADAAGGATVDAEARTALNALLAQLRLFGFIAP